MAHVRLGMRESELLAHIYARSGDLSRAFPHVVVGPGDDCAVVRVPGGGDLLLKVDQLVEGRHFSSATPTDLIARKAIARAVSDIAAMAGTPLAALAAAAIPAGHGAGRTNDLFDAMATWAQRFGCPLVGGDISATTSDIHLSVTVIGTPHTGRGPVLRSTAKPGDHVYVTSTLGGSFDRATGLGRHLTFEPRLAEAAWLADSLGSALHAMMDISDGLGIDGGRLAAASGVVVEIEATRIPVTPGVETRRAVSDGEDYELLFTADAACTVPPVCPATGTPITQIGRVVPGPPTPTGPAAILISGGARIDISREGWEHR